MPDNDEGRNGQDEPGRIDVTDGMRNRYLAILALIAVTIILVVVYV